MEASQRPSILSEETQQSELLPTNPEQMQKQGQGQGEEQKFVLELPELDFKLDLGDWSEGTGNRNGETTKCYHVCKTPLERNSNVSDSKVAAKRLDTIRGNGNASDSEISDTRAVLSTRNADSSDCKTAVECSETSIGAYITSSSEAAVKRPCDYILTLDTISRWFQGRNSYLPYQQVADRQYSTFTQEGSGAEDHIIALDYLAAFIIETAALEHERKNIGVSQQHQLLAKQDRMKELVNRARAPLQLVRECCDDLDLFMDLIDRYGRP